MDEMLDSAEKYYSQVLAPQRVDFFNYKATLRSAFLYSLDLYSVACRRRLRAVAVLLIEPA
jgi:hypothetical protein